jgi:hypothetical protein
MPAADRPDTSLATGGHGVSRADACSVLWDRAADSAYGTAAVATFFVLLEQRGPWGRDAARESHLDPALGGALDLRCSSRGGRFMLLRRPGPHQDRGGVATLLLAHTGPTPAQAWLLRAELGSAERLLELDWEALARGDREAVARSLPGASAAPPTLLVCTNGRRDVCCAVRGRPVAAAAARVAGDRVWESTHTGGHRFAPTGVLLPWGLTYARLTDANAVAVLQESLGGHTTAELLGPVHDRGRSALSPAAQCAESAVRTQLGETRLTALWAEPAPIVAPSEVSSTDDTGTDVLVRHEDGRAWIVGVTREGTRAARPESCGKAPVPVHLYKPTRIAPA